MIDTQRDIYRRNNAQRLKVLLQNKSIAPANKTTLTDFYKWLLINNISETRALRYIYAVGVKTKRTKKPLRNYKKTDIEDWIAELISSKLAEASKNIHRLAIKKLFKFLRKTQDYPPEVSWIKLKTVKNQLRAEDLPTHEEVLTMLKVAKNERDRAMLSVLYEGGFRIGELLAMEIKNVLFTPQGCYLVVPNSGKTGSRRVILRDSVPALTNYLNIHSRRDDPNAPLWLSKDKQPLTYEAARKALNDLVKRAGIKKRIHLHILRHAAVSKIANQVSDSTLKGYFGWDMGSRMPAVYVHLFNDSVDSAILSARGVEVKKQKENHMQPVKCANCGAENSVETSYCMICHLPTTDRLLAERMQVTNMITTLIDFLKLNEEQAAKLTPLMQRAKSMTNAELKAELKKRGRDIINS